MMLALLAVVDLDVAAGPWRRTLEIAVTVAAFVAIHFWVRANRRALDMVDARDAGSRRAHARAGAPVVATLPPRVAERATVTQAAARRGTVVVLPRRRSAGS
ncbi:MAG TPA: hypothetical protein VHZ49_18560 [Methylomirabilota bacterium]|jgi:hypothetical protein|nr:hypothetical protein [Methylomirabilota bacterium]